MSITWLAVRSDGEFLQSSSSTSFWSSRVSSRSRAISRICEGEGSPASRISSFSVSYSASQVVQWESALRSLSTFCCSCARLRSSSSRALCVEAAILVMWWEDECERGKKGAGILCTRKSAGLGGWPHKGNHATPAYRSPVCRLSDRRSA